MFSAHKKGIKPKQYFLATNVSSIKDVEFFYNHNFNNNNFIDANLCGNFLNNNQNMLNNSINSFDR